MYHSHICFPIQYPGLSISLHIPLPAETANPAAVTGSMARHFQHVVPKPPPPMPLKMDRFSVDTLCHISMTFPNETITYSGMNNSLQHHRRSFQHHAVWFDSALKFSPRVNLFFKMEVPGDYMGGETGVWVWYNIRV